MEGLGEKELVIVLCPFGVSLVGRTEAVPDFQGTETSVLGLSKTRDRGLAVTRAGSRRRVDLVVRPTTAQDDVSGHLTDFSPLVESPTGSPLANVIR